MNTGRLLQPLFDDPLCTPHLCSNQDSHTEKKMISGPTSKDRVREDGKGEHDQLQPDERDSIKSDILDCVKHCCLRSRAFESERAG